MESPQILIDTSILIDYFRKRYKDKTLLYSLSFTYRFAISTVTEFEFFAGLSQIHLEFTNKLFANFLILPFDSTCAQTASEIYKNLKSKNQLISPSDIFIAATAISLVNLMIWKGNMIVMLIKKPVIDIVSGFRL